MTEGRADIFTAARAGDADAIAEFLRRDASLAKAAGPDGWNALTHLCFSRELSSNPDQSQSFVRAAEMLLDAGADPNSGWFEHEHAPHPVFESVLYGAAGIAHNEALTRLLLDAGADPNENEVVYHAPETYDNGALRALVETGKLRADSLATMLVRKADWHDPDGARFLLENGADPNYATQWQRTAFHQAILRDNGIEMIELMLDHGADPTRTFEGRTAAAWAALRGRGDVLAELERRSLLPAFDGVERLVAACARGDSDAASQIARAEPALIEDLKSRGGHLIAMFAGTGNAAGVELLIELGIPVDAQFEGDPYFGTPPGSTALHVAAWRGWPAAVEALIRRGANVNARDGAGNSPLQLAVRACVDSYWMGRRSPDSVAALLAAGASARDVVFPCGYEPVDRLLAANRK